MIIRALIISTTLIFSGCLSNNVLMSKSIAHNNLDKISQLEIGMTQNEVYQIMRAPSNEDQLITGEGCYDIWFYITRSNALDPCHLVSRGLTPLVFKDGVFVGMGRQYYSQLIQKSKEPQLEPATPTKEEEENLELEKTLTPLKKTPATTEPIKEEKRENLELEKALTPTKKTPATTEPVKVKKQENLELEKTLTPLKKTPAMTEPVKVKKQENLELEKTLTPPKKTPVAPVKPPKKSSKPLSMCSKPKRIESSKDQGADKKSNNDSSEPMLDEEDREMLDQVREENFNDW